MKALKRTMAGEYSRELGLKVLAGQTRLAKMGFKQGGTAGYGLRRMLVSSISGVPKQMLGDGERKSIASDRVILVPGPDVEVQIVRDIYRMFVAGGTSVSAIADELNRRGVPYFRTRWDCHAVGTILRHPKYVGCHVFNRSSSKLCTPTVKLPRSQWVLTPAAFKPLVDAVSFEKAQQLLNDRTAQRSDTELLDGLKVLLAREGRLTLRLIKDSPITASPSTYRYRFGTMRRALQLIGYGKPTDYAAMDARRRAQFLRRELIERLVSMFPGEVSIEQRSRRWRGRLVLSDGAQVSVVLAPWIDRLNSAAWRVDPVWHEWDLVTLLGRLDKGNLSFFDFHVVPSIDRRTQFYLRERSEWLGRGVPLSELSDFCGLVRRMAGRTID